MPQAFSPTRPTLTIPGRSPRASNHVSPRSPRARDPQYWDTETISAHIEREVPKDKSPLLVKLVKDKQVDGHTILGTPRDVLERGLGLGDTELARDFMSVVDRMRGKTVLPPSPRRKYQSLVEIVEKLKELPSPGETSPMGNTTPELAPATAASPPPTPSDWDYDDEPSNGPNTHPFPYPIQTQGRFIGWSRDSTMYAPLLHPYAPSSPESAHMLSAIHVPRPLRASTSSLATHLEEVSSVVDHGDHHGPTHDAQSHDDLLGRAAAPMNHRQLPRLRGRSRSCPPEGPTRHVQPPRTSQELPAPPLRRPTPPPPPRHYEDVAIQTENFVDVEVQTDIVDWRTSPQDTAAQTSAVAHPPTTDIAGATQGITVTRSTDAPSDTADAAATGAGKELVDSPVDLAETKAPPQATSTQNASSGSPQAGPSTAEKPPAAQDAASPQSNTTTTSGGGASKAKEADPIVSTQQSASTPDATSSSAKSAKKPASKKNTSQTAQDKVSNSTDANSERERGTSKSTPPTPKNATPSTTRQNSSSGMKVRGKPKDSAPATPSTTKAAEEQPSTPVDTKAVKAARSVQGSIESSRDTTVVKEKTPKPESKPEESKIPASSAPAPPVGEKSAKPAPDSSTLGVDDTTSSTGATSGRDEQTPVLASDQTTKTTTDQTAVKESKSTFKDVLNESPVVADSQSSNVNIEMKGIAAKQPSSEAQSDGAVRSGPPPTATSGPSPPEPTTTSANASSPEIPGAFPNTTASTTATTTQPATKLTKSAWGSANKGLKLDTSGTGIRHEPVQATLPLKRSGTLPSATANRSGPAPLPPPPQGGQSHLRSASMNDGSVTQSLFTPLSGANGGSNGNGGRLGMDGSASASFSGSSFGRTGGAQGTPGGGQSADTFRGSYLVPPPVASSTLPPQRSLGFGSHVTQKSKPASPGWFSAVTNAVSGLVSPASAPATPSPAAAESPTRSSSLPPSAAGGRGQRVDTDYYATSLERNQSPLNPGVSSFVPTSRGGSSGAVPGSTAPSTSASKWAPPKSRQSQASTEGSRTETKPSSLVVETRTTPTAQSGSASDDPRPHTIPAVSPDPVTNEPEQGVDVVENKEPASKPLDTDAPSSTVASPEKESSTTGPVDVVSPTPAANAASSDVPPSSKVADTDSLVLAPQGESPTTGASKEVEETNDASSTAGAPKEADKTNDASSTVDPSKEADKTSDASAASAAAKDKELPPNPPSSESVKQTALTETTEVQDPASQPDASSVAVVDTQGSVHEDASDATKAAPATSTSTDQDPAPQLSVDTVLADNTSSQPPPVADVAQLNSEEASWDHVKREEANLTDVVVSAEPSQKPEESGGEVHAAEEQSHETEGFVDVGASTGKPPLPKLDTALTLDAGTTQTPQTEGSTPAVETTTPLPSNFKVLTDDEYNSMTAKFRRIYRADYQNVFNKAYVIPPKPKLPVARK